MRSPAAARWVAAVPALVAVVYAGLQALWYAATPLGTVPVLDEQENFHLAEAIASGNLPREALYRAIGYPALLALVRWLGISSAELPVASLFLGVIWHAGNAFLISRLARGWFDSRGAGLAAGLLTAMNPVLVHYAMQRLDTTFSLTLFLLGCSALFHGSRSVSSASLASACWVAATLTRPQFLLVWLALPGLIIVLHGAARGWRVAMVGLAVGVGLLGSFGLWHQWWSGEFRVLPTQGAYNLWAANRPGTHGRYFTQQVDVSQTAGHPNPTLRESQVLFQQEVGRPAHSDSELERHWSQRFRDHVRGAPAHWLGLLARKTYALLNDWEQYNNKTYAFHKERSPILAWNPLGWGVLLIAATAGAAFLARHHPAAWRTVALLATVYAASVLLFYVSARFRLPLAALACGLAGGALAHADRLIRQSWAARSRLGLLMATAAAVTYSSWDGVRDQRPYIQDHLLMARAAQQVGSDAVAWTEALAAFRLAPQRFDAAELVLTAGLNLRWHRETVPLEDQAWREAANVVLRAGPVVPAATRLLAAVVARDQEALRQLTQLPTARREAAFAAWLMTEQSGPPDIMHEPSSAPSVGLWEMLAREQMDPEAFQKQEGTERFNAVRQLRSRLQPVIVAPGAGS